jgi:hypothetical protein
MDGLEGGKHNSDNTETTIEPKSFKVTLTFDGITAKNELEAAKKIAKWCKEDSDTFTYDVENEKTKIQFTVDLSEDDEDAVLPIK